MASDNTIAPNEKAEVQRTMDEHPEIDTMHETQRAEIIDITARRLNPGGGEKPWGRKARQNDPNNPNLNTDAMTFLRPDGNFEIYDVISGVDGSATWDNHGVVKPGENGYWWPPNPVDGESGGGGGIVIQKDEEQDQRIAELESQIASLEARVSALESVGIVLDGKKIALRAAVNGLYLRVKMESENREIEAVSGDSQSYEEFFIKDMG